MSNYETIPFKKSAVAKYLDTAIDYWSRAKQDEDYLYAIY